MSKANTRNNTKGCEKGMRNKIKRKENLPRKLLSLIMAAVMVLTLLPTLTVPVLAASEVWDGTSAASFAYGDGSEEHPFEIATAEQLALMADLVNEHNQTPTSVTDMVYGGAFYKLTDNIVLNGDAPDNEWTPIGNGSNKFNGTFDGNGKVISGIFIDLADTDNVGLFGYTNYKADIQDVGLEIISVTGKDNVGGLAGYQYNGEITGCYVTGADGTGSVSGCGDVGGLIGGSGVGSTITDCYATVDVTGTDDYVGGLVGRLSSSDPSITGSYNAGSVSGSGSYVGGVTGYNDGTVMDCYNSGSVSGTGDDYVGGLVGRNDGTVTDCYNSGSVSSTGDYRVGGVAGQNFGTVQYCYNIGSISGKNDVGGVAGENYDFAKLLNSFNLGSVSGYSNVGGVAGSARYSTVSNCYNTGAVSGNNGVGGVAGSGHFTLQNSYNAGFVSGNDGVGSVIGYYSGSYTVSNCYYDKQMSPTEGIGYLEESDAAAAAGVLTSEMLGDALSESLGDAGDWVFTEGLYPRLAEMDESDAAVVSATPVELFFTSSSEYETFDAVKSDFALGGSGNGVSWMSSDTDVISIDGYDAEVTCQSAFTPVTLTASKNDAGRTVTLTVFWDPPTVDCPYDGCEEEAVLITSGAMLEAIGRSEELLAGCYVLGNDIDLAGEPWTPLGTFTGHFFGGGHKIKNLTVDISGENCGDIFLDKANEQTYIIPADDVGAIFGAGLFMKLEGAEVSDLILENPSVQVITNQGQGFFLAGALAGLAEGGEIRGVSVTNPDIGVTLVGTGLSHFAAGGLAGYFVDVTPVSGVSVSGGSVSGTVSDYTDEEGTYTSYFNGDSVEAVGGIVGASYRSVVVNAASDTEVGIDNEDSAFMDSSPDNQLNIYAGGIAGYSSAADKLAAYMCVHNSYSRSDISVAHNGVAADIHAGGLVGYLEDSAINNYYLAPDGGGISVADHDTGSGVNSGLLFGTVVNPADDGYIISRNYSEDDSAAVGAAEGSGEVGTAGITDAIALLAALNDGREDVAEGVEAQYGIVFALQKVFDWKIDAAANDGLPIFGKYSVMFNSNGGSAVPSQSVSYGGTATQPTAPTKTGYTFGGWYSDSGLTTAFDFGAAITGDITLYAKWTPESSGGDDDDDDRGNGGGRTSTPSAPPTPPAGSNGNITATPPTLNQSTGVASTQINSSALNAALTSAAQDGNGKKTVEITVPPVQGAAAYETSLPASALSSSADTRLAINTAIANVTLPGNMLSGTGLKGDAGLTIGTGDKSDLPDDVKAAIGDKPLIQLTLSIDGRQTDWSNPDAPVTVSIPYTPTPEELANPESIVVWYIDGKGNAVSVPNGRYDPVTGTVVVDVTHFSDYAVVYNQVSFSDVARGAWYYRPVSFIAARGITTGTGGGSFGPEVRLTRGEFIVMLMKAYGITPDENPTDNFADSGNSYYTGYLAAVKRLGISEGTGGNMFEPDKEITRQEMFTLLYNALKVIGKLPTGNSGKTLGQFTDAGQIDSWAKDAMTLLVKTGTVGGNDGKLNPTGTATRAEIAQILYNMLGK